MNDRASRQVIVAGGGIAGLTASLAFAGHGYGVRVFEQARQIEAIGAGIQLSPNATGILRDLGVLDLLRPLAVRPEAVVLKDAKSLRELARVPLGEAGERRWRAPYLVAHRADLHQALMARVGQEGTIQMVTGAAVSEAACRADGVSVSIDGTDGVARAEGDFLVGADGVWSKLRGTVGAPVASRFSGELAWRATVEADSPAGKAFAAVGAADCVTTFLHPGFHLVAYPVRSGAAFNLVAFTKGERIADGWSGNAEEAILSKAMRKTAPALYRLAGEAGPWTAWPIHTVDPHQAWTSGGGIALVGDAAHAMTPFAAQGAAMAIEDAVTLARFVAGTPDNLAKALADWEQLRRPRVLKVARRGAINRLAWHASGPVALARNLFLTMRIPEKLAADLDWLYGWKMQDPSKR